MWRSDREPGLQTLLATILRKLKATVAEPGDIGAGSRPGKERLTGSLASDASITP